MTTIRQIVILCLIGLVSLIGRTQAQGLPLSETATASVLTCGPGNDFYTTFGHSAIRITDTARGIDWVYNYGTFDFDTPHFYWKFTRGQLEYRLSREHFSDFVFTYNHEKRAVWEQRLNFTHQEINNLYIALEWNYLPENRYYRYDILRDNCATRVRDMVEAAPSHRDIDISLPDKGEHSYRYYLGKCMDNTLEWWRLGIDIILGLNADHHCTNEEDMFLPMEMMSRYEYACLVDRQHTGATLADDTVQLLPDTREPLHRSFPPVVVFALLLAVVCMLSWKRLWPRWGDRVLFIIAGIAGLLLIFMWVGTGHWCTQWNLNILWTSPMLILIAIRLDRSPRWALWLQEACFLAAAVYVVACGLSPAIIPIIFTLAIRIGVIMTNKNTSKVLAPKGRQ